MRLELTRRGDYAVRAMLALAEPRAGGAGQNGWLSVRRIAERMAIPHRFLPQVMRDLAAAGLVEAQTGRSGGYRLARPAVSITLLDVIEAVEGDSRRQACVLRGGPCGRDGYCAVHAVFFAAQEALLGHFERTSLAEVAAVLPSLDGQLAPSAGREARVAAAAARARPAAEAGLHGPESGASPSPAGDSTLSRRSPRRPEARPSRSPSARRRPGH